MEGERAHLGWPSSRHVIVADLTCWLYAGDGPDSGLEASSSPVVVLEEDADVAMLQIPNTTFQSRPQDVRVCATPALSRALHTLFALTTLAMCLYPIQLKGADILVPTQQEHPPPLCGKWVHLSCPKVSRCLIA